MKTTLYYILHRKQRYIKNNVIFNENMVTLHRKQDYIIYYIENVVVLYWKQGYFIQFLLQNIMFSDRQENDHTEHSWWLSEKEKGCVT